MYFKKAFNGSLKQNITIYTFSICFFTSQYKLSFCITAKRNFKSVKLGFWECKRPECQNEQSVDAEITFNMIVFFMFLLKIKLI